MLLSRAAGGEQSAVSTIPGSIAVTVTTINVVSGFMITDRMLELVWRKERQPL